MDAEADPATKPTSLVQSFLARGSRDDASAHEALSPAQERGL
jgi:hypothetical protein